MYDPEPPCVSVIIVNYNGINVLPHCISSLLKTNYPNFDIIVVDNGSSDASVGILKQFRKQSKVQITILENKVNLGFAEANNIGVASSSCKYVAFLNNDTMVDENWLGSMVKILEENQAIGAVQSLLLKSKDEVDSVGAAMDIFGTASDLVVPIGKLGLLQGETEIFSACAASMLIKRGLFIQIGEFDPKFFAYFEDVDLSWRIRLNGLRIVFDINSVVYHLRGNTSRKFTGNLFDFHLYKNQIAMLIKNHTLESLVMVMPVVGLLYVFRVLNGIIKKDSGLAVVALKAILWNILELRYLMGQRKYVNKYVRKVNDDKIRERMSKHPLQLWR